MASSVFFKFKSQKEPQRVTFDGTGITVFELKREIISISHLGDGTDFDLSIYNEDTNDEYTDDTEIIPRSSSVTARRLPASKPGQGKAARYVSGRMPANARSSHRSDQSNTPLNANKGTSSGGSLAIDKAQTEEEKIAAMHQMGADQWEYQKQQMAGATPVFRPGAKGKQVTVPDHKPPPGYICYRCHEKGHWIQACPTNNDPNFDGRPRVKRTTGIPRSMLQTVEKPDATSNDDGLTDESRQPSGVMVNAEGNYVVAVPDKASWEQYQAKAQASAAQDDVAETGNKELAERGLLCPIDKRLFVNPMKTPCCGKTFCHECIENALLDGDLVCPECSTDGVLIDNLVVDEEMVKKIATWEEDKKKAEKQAKDTKAQTPEAAGGEATNGDHAAAEKLTSNKSTPQPDTTRSKSPSKSPGPDGAKKRPAEEQLENERSKQAPTNPAAMQKSQQQSNPTTNGAFDQSFIEQMNALAGTQNMANGFPNMPFPPPTNVMPGAGFPGMGGMPPMMGGMNPMQMQMMMNNPMMMQQFMQQNPAMMNGMPGFNPQQQQWAGNMPGGFPNQGQGNWQQGGGGYGGNYNNNNNIHGHQQQHGNFRGGGRRFGGGFNGAAGNQGNVGDDDDGAYMRKPVNPNRHHGRQKKVRPMDYREL